MLQFFMVSNLFWTTRSSFSSFITLFWIYASYSISCFIIGIKGDTIVPYSTAYQSKFTDLKKLCFFIASHPLTPSLVLGYNFSKRFMKSFNYSLIFLFFHSLFFEASSTTFSKRYFSVMSSSLKGKSKFESW